jgi:hypothetical protein
MRWGIIHLFCPICGQALRLNGDRLYTAMHHKEFGMLCGKACFDEAELKYARMILGKDEEPA